MKQTIYIDSNLTPRYSPTGWPDINRWHPGHCMKEDYLDALAKAKAESVPFENLKEFIFAASQALGEEWPTPWWEKQKPDTFVEAEIGEVEVVYQGRTEVIGNSWREISKEHYYSQVGSFPDRFRIVARLKKPENSAHGYTEGAEIVNEWKDRAIAHLSEGKPRCECELLVEKYFGISPEFPEDVLVPGADYGNLVNLLAMFRDEQLAAANTRIKELEDFIADLYETIDPKEMKRELHEFLTE